MNSPEEQRRVGTQARVPYTQIHTYLRRSLETVQDLAMIVLMVILIGITIQALWQLGNMAFVQHRAAPFVLSQVVYILILTELYRTLIFYLREHRVSVSLMVEVAIVATLQELILRGTEHEYRWQRMIGIALILAVLGGLLALQRWMSTSRGESSDTSAH